MNNENFVFEEEEGSTAILDYLYKFLRYWYWIVLSLIISFGIAYVYLKKFTPVYQVSATLLIKDEKKMNSDVIEKLDMNIRNKLVENEIEVLKSRALIGRVVDKLNLVVSYWKEGKFRNSELHTESPIVIKAEELTPFAFKTPLYVKVGPSNMFQLLDEEKNDLGTYEYGKLIKNKFGDLTVTARDSIHNQAPATVKVIFRSRDGLVNYLIKGLQIELLNPQSSLISLGLESAVPKQGKDILTELLNVYSTASLEDKNKEAANTLRFIEERLKLITAELGGVEQNIEQYRKAQGVSGLSSEAATFLKKVEDNDSKLNEINVQSQLLDRAEEYLASSQAGVVAPATMMGASDAILSGYVNQLSQLESDRAKLAQAVQPGNPSLEALNAQIRTVKQSIKESLNKQRASLTVAKQNLMGINSTLESAILKIPTKEREFVGIKRQANIKEDLYLLLLKTREQTSLSYASTVTDSRVVDAPYSSEGPIRPDRGNIYLMALLIGLILPIALIAGKEALTNTIQSKKEIEKKTGLKVFGEVGLQPKGEKGEIIDTRSRNFVSEQIRMLRSNMRYLFLDTHESIGKSILITSSISGEGKSFMTLNLAASLSLLGKKVVIIGLDLRKPRIHEHLQVSNKVGMSNYLIGQLSLADIIQSTSIENLYMIPSGPVPPNPSELISRGRIKELVTTLRQPFDYIIIDTPPIGLVTDALLLESCTDVCFYLIRHEKTPKSYLSAIKELNEKKVFRSINIIFNAINYKNSPSYSYGYGQRKTEYYGEEPDKKSWLKNLVTKD
ncbi:polysaccharide biosynthesis tyrosine autokinase [Spirosoma sp. BT702]|uniref:non-specific protein-tyrosine kinase n=1 Tax=Spirosoma profusum TaxID=2771354 RepID=A0A927AQJ7_9BACT|nr:polysaccharide biosynthesis tyrosine autokinase [Spirosoma profusum]MBD2700663.1 polysaccharide biosynthesis tyrosine autokinase [Spirosoma profusum]